MLCGHVLLTIMVRYAPILVNTLNPDSTVAKATCLRLSHEPETEVVQFLKQQCTL